MAPAKIQYDELQQKKPNIICTTPALGWVALGSKLIKIFMASKATNLRVKKIFSGRVEKYPGWRRVKLLFTAGQK